MKSNKEKYITAQAEPPHFASSKYLKKGAEVLEERTEEEELGTGNYTELYKQ